MSENRSFVIRGYLNLILALPFIFAASPWNSPPTLAAQLDDAPLPQGAILRLGSTHLRQRQGPLGVAFSPDSKQLVTTGWGDSIRFWDVTTGRQVRRLQTSDRSGTFAVAFSPNGKLLATVGERGWVRLWDLETGKIRFQSMAHKRIRFGVRVYSVAFAPDGKRFATAGADNVVRVWNVASGLEESLFDDDGGADCHPVAFSPDGRLLAAGSGRRGASIRIWDLEKKDAPVLISAAHEGSLSCLLFTPNGDQVVSSGTKRRLEADGTRTTVSDIRVWDVATGRRVGEFDASDQLQELLGDCSIAMSSDGGTLCSAHDSEIAIWQFDARALVRVVSDEKVRGGRSHGLAISPNGKWVAAVSSDHMVRLWDVASGAEIRQGGSGHTHAILTTAFSHDGSLIATGGGDATVQLWDASSGEHLGIVGNGVGWFRFVDFLPDEKRIVMASGAPSVGEIIVGRIRDGQVLQRFTMDGQPMCGDVSHDGLRIAVGTGAESLTRAEVASTQIRVFDMAQGLAVHSWPVDKSLIEGLSFAASGGEIWSTGSDHVVRRWDIASGRQLEEARANPLEVAGFRRIVTAPDASRFVMGGLVRKADGAYGGAIRATSRRGESLWHHTIIERWPSILAISADGKVVATYLGAVGGSQLTGRITLWSVDKGEELLSFELPDGSVRSLAFSPDGTRLVSGMDRGHALVWDVSRRSDR